MSHMPYAASERNAVFVMSVNMVCICAGSNRAKVLAMRPMERKLNTNICHHFSWVQRRPRKRDIYSMMCANTKLIIKILALMAGDELSKKGSELAVNADKKAMPIYMLAVSANMRALPKNMP